MSFSFNTKQFPDSCIISLQGKILSEIDIDSLLMEVNQLIEKNKCQLIFNVRELSYLNSVGINLFMKILTKSRVSNGDLIFYGVNGNVESLFKIAKLNEIYTIYATEEDALNHFKNK